MKISRLTLTCIFISLYSLALSQDFIHPLAIQESENELVYFMNEDKEIIPEGLPYSYKREAIRKKSKKPYRVIDYYPNGAVEMKTWMSHPDPISKRYQQGFVSFFQNGDTNIFIEYKDQRKNGEFRAYYESGQLKRYGRFINGKTSGAWKSFFETGLPKDVGIYFQGEKHGVWISYHEVGSKSSSGMYVKGKKQGKWEQYHSKGQLYSVSYYENGELNGPYEERYVTGIVSEFGEYENGKKQAEWNTFNEDADLKSVMHYENDVLDGDYMVLSENKLELITGQMIKNKFTGVSHVFTSAGDLIMDKFYTNGVIKRQIYYNPDGSVQRKETLENYGFKPNCFDTSGNEIACEFDSYSLPYANKDLESELAEIIDYSPVGNYAPRGVYAFDVDTEGKIENSRIVESANADYDSIALEKIQTLSWNPGVEDATKAVFSNHAVIHFDQVCQVNFGEFYLNDTALLKDALSHNPEFDFPDQYPSFRVGMNGLSEYMAAELKYPEMAKNEGLSGICIAKFAIEPSGVLSEIEVDGSVHPMLDYESIRFLENMPEWIPGIKTGRKTKMYNYLPIRFTLN